MRKLEGKTALITGCNRGIGNSILHLYAKEGANIIACSRKKSVDILNEYTKLESDYSIKIYPLLFDLSDDENIKCAMKELYALKLSIDILVNNAGIATGGFLSMTKISDVKNVFQINYFSQVLITQYVSKLMQKQKSGSIINISSILGIDALSGGTAYGASKAAMGLFTKSLAKELGAFNIRVNAIAPNLIETDMAQLMEQKAFNDMIEKTTLKRVGKPIEIAKTALFLASDDSSYITGQIIRVDGGI